jgi:hypothetical protein
MVIGLVNFKDWVNKSESMRAMQQLGQIVLSYREQNGSVPPNYYVDDIRKQLEGIERAGDLKYRARWIEYGAGPDTILAYTRKKYGNFLFGSGAIVLRLDGRVEWMKMKEFDELLAKQQTSLEIEMEHKKL